MGSEHPRVSLASRTAKSRTTAALIVAESDQAAFESNHTDSKADVTCTTDAATHGGGPFCV